MGKTFDSEKYKMNFCPFCQGDANYPILLRGLGFAKNVEALG